MRPANETHTYDGQLGERKAELKKHLERASSQGRERKLELFGKLAAHLRTINGHTPQAEMYLSIIIQDFAQSNSGPNYDPTNDLFAIDLLVLCAELCFHDDASVAKEASELLNAQLTEMATGFCAQGRTHRLFQVVASFSEYLHPGTKVSEYLHPGTKVSEYLLPLSDPK